MGAPLPHPLASRPAACAPADGRETSPIMAAATRPAPQGGLAAPAIGGLDPMLGRPNLALSVAAVRSGRDEGAKNVNKAKRGKPERYMGGQLTALPTVTPLPETAAPTLTSDASTAGAPPRIKTRSRSAPTLPSAAPASAPPARFLGLTLRHRRARADGDVGAPLTPSPINRGFQATRVPGPLPKGQGVITIRQDKVPNACGASIVVLTVPGIVTRIPRAKTLVPYRPALKEGVERNRDAASSLPNAAARTAAPLTTLGAAARIMATKPALEPQSLLEVLEEGALLITVVSPSLTRAPTFRVACAILGRDAPRHQPLLAWPKPAAAPRPYKTRATGTPGT